MSVILISVIGLIIMVITVIKINGGPIDARLPLENINWLFRKRKYKIVKDEERHYSVYQQTIIGIWYFLTYYCSEESATQYTYRRYRETTKKHTRYVKYITIEPETDPTKLID